LHLGGDPDPQELALLSADSLARRSVAGSPAAVGA
jgi:hypothetical protein